MKILIIGSQGQLGWELARSIPSLGEVTPVDFPDLDLTDPANIRSWIRDNKPDVIINTAAYTAVDQAESEVDVANRVNAVAPLILAEESQKLNSLLIHFSTDYVFNGKKGNPYTESDFPDPLNIYGKSKLEGERAIQSLGGKYFIYRTSWLYSTRRDCFVTKVLKWARTEKIIRIASDQIGSPTWSRSLSDATHHSLQTMIQKGESWIEENAGIYHLAGNGSVNRFQWAEKILQYDPKPEECTYSELKKTTSEAFDLPAKRPQNTALDCSRFQNIFNSFYSDWETSLKEALTE
jgi:dTDP-4-dehydrorhamnose reductase